VGVPNVPRKKAVDVKHTADMQNKHNVSVAFGKESRVMLCSVVNIMVIIIIQIGEAEGMPRLRDEIKFAK
jgi:hypothetical protein